MKAFPAATLTRDPIALKEAARKSPVAITEYKRPRFVLMTYDKYLALTARAADPRRSLRTEAMPENLKALAREALDQPCEP
jgi:PHD/YefM family antitoxin component YafN of YafNO toxin-antitoxin module